ncbi:Ig-like domain-containing protein [Bacteroidales bacterium OttesenSCG-928-C03]|nr:Ig-like domain-containing protein [Bacteroidales bacterium OttesenSCG-928-C03]MDL2325493.1 Ig-like domain-containing protein [Bacteroidales bacterium OttesenSCG-928-A14]
MKKLSLLSVLCAFALLFASCGDKAVTGVSLSKSTLSLKVGDSETLTATVSPDDADDKAISWKSSDNSVATVSSGKVTGVAAGKATITVTTNDGGKTATCEVTVTNPGGGEDGVKVTFGGTSWTASVAQATIYSEYSLVDFWAGKDGLAISENYPIVNFVANNATGNTTYDKDDANNNFYMEYYDATFMVDQNNSPYGDWWVATGTTNITVFGGGKISGTTSATMYDAVAMHSTGGSGVYTTKEMTITFNNVTLTTGSKSDSFRNSAKKNISGLKVAR